MDTDTEYREPHYSAAKIPSDDWVPICEFCACVVLDVVSHNTWHLQLWTVLSKIKE